MHPGLKAGRVSRLLRDVPPSAAKQKPKACISVAPWVNIQQLSKRGIFGWFFV